MHVLNLRKEKENEKESVYSLLEPKERINYYSLEKNACVDKLTNFLFIHRIFFPSV